MDKGIGILAQNQQGQTVLQLACMRCDVDTVQLIDHGGWTDTLSFECAFHATLGGKLETLQMLVQNYSIDLQQTTTEGFSLLHAAAAWHRLDCLGYLLSIGATSGNEKLGLSTVDLASKATADLPPTMQYAKLDRGFHFLSLGQKCIALLYRHDAQFGEVTTPVDERSIAIAQHRNDVVAENKQQRRLLQMLCANQTRAHTASDLGSSNATVKSAEAAGTATDRTTVLLQLVHAETGVRHETVYSLNTATIAQLHELSGEEGPSVLLRLVQPSEGFASPTAASVHTSTSGGITASETPRIQLLKYDGESTTYSISDVILSDMT